MKNLLWLIIPTSLLVAGCSKTTEQNPFFVEWDTPYGVPPFDKIKNEHYLPAFEKALEEHKKEIEQIATNPEDPTFANTILAYDQSGALLRKVSGVFYGLNAANTNEEMDEISKTITPMTTAHYNQINMDQRLFGRIKAVYEKRNELNLNEEDMRLVEKTYRDFERSGATLPEEKREELKSLNEKMAMISLQLNQNLLKENKNFLLIIDKEEDLAGLTPDIISAAATLAKQNGHEGKWVFDLSKPSWIPFLQYSERRELREKLYRAYFMRGDNDNQFDNKKLFAELISLRQKAAQLLGYSSYAHYFTDEQMAKTPENVMNFLTQVWTPALKRAKQERDDMQAIINQEGGKFNLQSWDWWYYAEKVRKNKYDLDEESLRPYLSLENVKQGIFYVTEQLYGLKYQKRSDIPVYHPEVDVYEVQEANGTPLAILYIDPHPRAGAKKGGAWCGSFRSGSYKGEERIIPLVYIVMNFTRPTEDKPALLSWDETETYFHEFGHALHNFFAEGRYYKTARNVPRDFVELPSQVLEHWAAEPEVLKVYAKHYQTGEPMPDELITKLNNSGHFNQGFQTTEYVAAAILDIKWHTNTSVTPETNVREFENSVMKEIGLIEEIVPRYRTTNFSHIFSSGYASGYYVYLWAGVLDADAFAAFKESGNIFNQELAAKFRKHILAQNALGEGMEQYIKFRGKAPSIDALLVQRGLK